MKQIGCALLLFLVGCASLRSTQDIPAVNNFSGEQFLGKWYEIARLPNVYETDLKDVTLTYELKAPLACLTQKGFREDRERILTEKGYYKGSSSVGEFRLELLSDFNTLHRVIWVGPKYEMAIATGVDRSSLWIIAREKQLPKAELDKLVKMAQDWGFDTAKLEYTEHTK